MTSPLVPSEAITPDDIATLLQRLSQLKSELKRASAALEPLEAELEQARHEYQDRITPLRRQMNKLGSEVEDLNAQLNSYGNSWIPDGTDGPPPPPPSPPPRPPASTMRNVAVAKDKLLEHAFRVLNHNESDEDSDLIGKIQEMVKDPSVTFGAMLERLSWGPLWERRSSRETLADQYCRLSDWEKVLAAHLTEVQQRRANLEQDERYERWQIRQQGPVAWEAYLASEEQPLRADIANLAAQKAILEQELRRRQQGKVP